jgi:hypothetical protein
MIPIEDVQTLAGELMDRHEFSLQPVLLLGAGCARAAGVPSLETVAFQVFANYFQDPSLIAKYLPPPYWLELQEQPEEQRDYEPLLQAFYQFMAGLSGMARYNVLKPFYDRIPVPRFYRDLAQLLQGRYFSHVLTTSFDALLEGALNELGLTAPRDYEVISLGADPSRRGGSRSSYATEAAITLVKLHGDLAQLKVALSPEEIEQVLRAQQAMVKGELSQDMVVVGYAFESEPVSRWLRWTPGTLWWVSEEQPAGEPIAVLEEKRPIHYIQGASARPEEFFGVLLTVLKSMAPRWTDEGDWPPDWGSSLESGPVMASQEGPVSKGLVAFTAPASSSSPANLPDADELELQYLQQQLQSSRSVLSSLEQQAVTKMGPDLSLKVQMDYQQQQIAQLEARLREVSYSGSHLVKLMRRITNSVRHAGGDSGAISFLTKQANTVKQEYERDEPNQDVVSAAIGATVYLAARLGPDVVDQEAVADLGSIAPGAVGRGL